MSDHIAPWIPSDLGVWRDGLYRSLKNNTPEKWEVSWVVAATGVPAHIDHITRYWDSFAKIAKKVCYCGATFGHLPAFVQHDPTIALTAVLADPRMFSEIPDSLLDTHGYELAWATVRACIKIIRLSADIYKGRKVKEFVGQERLQTLVMRCIRWHPEAYELIKLTGGFPEVMVPRALKVIVTDKSCRPAQLSPQEALDKPKAVEKLIGFGIAGTIHPSCMSHAELIELARMAALGDHHDSGPSCLTAFLGRLSEPLMCDAGFIQDLLVAFKDDRLSLVGVMSVTYFGDKSPVPTAWDACFRTLKFSHRKQISPFDLLRLCRAVPGLFMASAELLHIQNSYTMNEGYFPQGIPDKYPSVVQYASAALEHDPVGVTRALLLHPIPIEGRRENGETYGEDARAWTAHGSQEMQFMQCTDQTGVFGGVQAMVIYPFSRSLLDAYPGLFREAHESIRNDPIIYAGAIGNVAMQGFTTSGPPVNAELVASQCIRVTGAASPHLRRIIDELTAYRSTVPKQDSTPTDLVQSQLAQLIADREKLRQLSKQYFEDYTLVTAAEFVDQALCAETDPTHPIRPFSGPVGRNDLSLRRDVYTLPLNRFFEDCDGGSLVPYLITTPRDESLEKQCYKLMTVRGNFDSEYKLQPVVIRSNSEALMTAIRLVDRSIAKRESAYVQSHKGNGWVNDALVLCLTGPGDLKERVCDMVPTISEAVARKRIQLHGYRYLIRQMHAGMHLSTTILRDKSFDELLCSTVRHIGYVEKNVTWSHQCLRRGQRIPELTWSSTIQRLLSSFSVDSVKDLSGPVASDTVSLGHKDADDAANRIIQIVGNRDLWLKINDESLNGLATGMLFAGLEANDKKRIRDILAVAKQQHSEPNSTAFNWDVQGIIDRCFRQPIAGMNKRKYIEI